MKSKAPVLLFPVLKVAQFVGLLPCLKMRKNNRRLRHSKKLAIACSSFFILVFSPYGIYYEIEKLLNPSVKILGGILKYCVNFSSAITIMFPIIYCWHFISNSCAVLSKVMAAFAFAENQIGARLFKFRLRISAYQCVGLFAGFTLCLTFAICFSTLSTWQIQFILNFTRMQFYVIEMCINVLNFIFSIYFGHISYIVKHQAIKMSKIKVTILLTDRVKNTLFASFCR